MEGFPQCLEEADSRVSASMLRKHPLRLPARFPYTLVSVRKLPAGTFSCSQQKVHQEGAIASILRQRLLRLLCVFSVHACFRQETPCRQAEDCGSVNSRKRVCGSGVSVNALARLPALKGSYQHTPSKPSTFLGSSALLPSIITLPLIAEKSSSVRSLNSLHSVTTRQASAPFRASFALSA